MRVVVGSRTPWPTALHLSGRGHNVLIVDNLVRRKTDVELEISSLTPIAPLSTRLKAWKEVSGREIVHQNVDVAQNFYRVKVLFDIFGPTPSSISPKSARRLFDEIRMA